MKKNRFIILVLLLTTSLSVFASAAKSNKSGIEKFNEENYEAALTDFRDAQLSDPKSPIIGHNLGATLYQQKRYDKAFEELSKMLTEVEDSVILSQVYYNLGNVMFRQDSLTQSIQLYQKAIQYNPEDKDAKFNLELARARLKDNSEQQQQNQQQQQKKIEPSEFAKELKKKAEELIEQNLFHDAYALMMDGLQQDQTVSAFQDFINKIKDIVDIEDMI